jgi:hypothetical protein
MRSRLSFGTDFTDCTVFILLVVLIDIQAYKSSKLKAQSGDGSKGFFYEQSFGGEGIKN